MNVTASLIAAVIAFFAPSAEAANTPPLSNAWNIAPAGKASSSGELLFRVTPGDGSDAIEVTVFVQSGANDSGVANNIRRALNLQLRADLFNVEPGEGANVLLRSQGERDFSLELIDSDVENVRVMVQSAAPVAPPTVPRQSAPATPAQPATPQSPGDALPPAMSAPPANASQPSSSPPSSSPPLPDSSEAPNAPAGNGASAPAPTAPPPGGGPANAPPPTR